MKQLGPSDKRYVDLITEGVKRSQLDYHEYKFLSDEQLKTYFANSLLKSLETPDTYTFVTESGHMVSGLITCTLDHFDTENFGFACYRITDLVILSDDFTIVKETASQLISALEEKLIRRSTPVHLRLSINNNMYNAGQLFNSLTHSGFYYLHTLLNFESGKKRIPTCTFYPQQNITIRAAEASDVEKVGILAQKSFKYCRFYMDPFLIKEKAGPLFRIIAENSLLHGYADVMFVAELENKIVGYYSIKKRVVAEFEKTVGEGIVSAVDEDFRGKGIFSKLDDHIQSWFFDHTDFAKLGTYLANFPVHKTWINKGLGLIQGVHQFSKKIS
jgi:GNAT superfamily N-acetyltransferase